MRLEYNGFRVLLGGDLNLPAENFLMLWYGNEKNVPSPLSGSNSLLKTIGKKTVIDCSRTRFEADLMKTCHHGSSDVSNEFLCATNACAYVVSSGDQESHVHPRPDLLGLLGKVGRGTRPLLLSTELLRSTREREDSKLRVELIDVTKKIETELTKEGGGNRETLKTLKAKRKRIPGSNFQTQCWRLRGDQSPHRWREWRSSLSAKRPTDLPVAGSSTNWSATRWAAICRF